MAQTAIAGTATLAVDGQTYLLAGGFKYNPASVTRDSLVGMDSVHGFKEAPLAPSISATLRDTDGLSVAAINAMRDVTVTASLANGKVIVGRNMWTVDTQEVDSVEATLEVKWEGLEVLET